MDFSYLDSLLEQEVGRGDIEETTEGYRNIWVVAETPGGIVSRPTLEAMGQARDMADQIGVYVYVVVLGTRANSASEELIAYGADKVLLAESPDLDEYQPEVYTAALAQLITQYRPEIVLMPATTLGNDLAPRLAQRLNTGLLSPCIKIEVDMSERLLLGTYPTLGGEVYHTAACPETRPQIATLLPGYFRTPYKDTYRAGDVQTVEVDLADVPRRLIWTDRSAGVERPRVPLRKARVIVSAGRGMGDEYGFALVTQLAEALGGMVGGSRGAFDAGWIAEEQVIGIGGETVSPELYIACGLSGDIHHYTGVQKAKFVVAINPDEQAPIMKVANVAIVGDARQVIPAMLRALGK